MNKSLETLCILFSLFYLSSAILVNTYEQITEELTNLTKRFHHENICNSSLVPKLEETQNVSVAEISCRAIESLKKVCPSERKHFHLLHRTLTILKAKAKKVNHIIKCAVSEEEQDILSFLRSLLGFFKSKYFNHKP